MTIRTFIAEDEPLTLRSIKQSIEEANAAFRVVGHATDGQSALKLILEMTPDVVFTDIRMPVIDGLGLIRKLREANCRSMFVILSGYKEFDYAKEAITLGVEDYLIKPIHPDQLKTVLDQVKQKVDRDRRKQQQEYLDSHRDEMPPAGLFPDHEQYGLVHMCLGAYRDNPLEPAPSIDKLIDMPKLIDRTANGQPYWMVRGKCQNEQTIILACHEANAVAVFAERLSGRIAELTDLGLPTTLVIGNSPMPIRLYPEHVADMERKLHSCSLFGTASIIEADSPSEVDAPLPDELLEELQLLRSLVRRRKERDVMLLFRKLLRSSQEQRLTQHLLAKLLRRICHLLIKETGLEFEPRDAVDNLIASSRNYEELVRNLETFYQETTAIGKMDSPLDKGSEAILDEIQAYMDEHFHTSITIQQIADHFGFNYSYLCSLFKKVKLKSPNEYIIEKRIEKAKQLLRTTELNIKAVGSFVGYEDPYYFSRIFKTVAGLTPSGYRKRSQS